MTSSHHHHHHSSRTHSGQWVQATDIDDGDLTFGGKSLSEWYEEDRRRFSQGSSDDDSEQERRGRERERVPYHKK